MSKLPVDTTLTSNLSDLPKCRVVRECFTVKEGEIHSILGWRDDSIDFELDYLLIGIGKYGDESLLLVDKPCQYRPNWYPLSHFQLEGLSELPSSWRLAIRPFDSWEFIITLSSLLSDESLMAGVIERDSSSLSKFKSILDAL